MKPRYYPREEVRGSAVFTGGGFTGEGQVLDLTVLGCLIDSSLSPKKGDSLTLRLELSQAGAPFRVVQGVVRWLQGSRFGVEFIEMDPKERLRYNAVVGRFLHRLRLTLADLCTPLFRKHPRFKNAIRALDKHADLVKHSAAAIFPQIIQPDPQDIFITLTANCNLRCVGCRYGRDFMPGAQLAWPIVRDLLDDCKQNDIRNVRLYGGEPLLHKDLPRIVEYAVHLGLHPWLTTNGILLKEKIDDLYQAGLRQVDVGFYGIGEDYNTYVQRKDQHVRMEAGIAYLRDRYSTDIKLRLGWVLMRPTCSLQAVQELCKFADRYATSFGVNLIHYSLPYFTEGPDGELQFRPEDRPAIDTVVAELIRLKHARPDLLSQSVESLRSIPDWLLKGPNMKVPCDRYRLIWVGADGTVQLCYVTFKLGNLHEKRLSQMLFTPEHRQASRDAFALKCPNCHCAYSVRIDTHAPSRLRYRT